VLNQGHGRKPEAIPRGTRQGPQRNEQAGNGLEAQNPTR
jgi:hypothetical protein